MAKKKARTLPKKIAGVKVPKAFRKSTLGAFLASPLGVAILADIMVEIGEAALSRDTKAGRAVRRVMQHPIDAVRHGGAKATHTALSAALTEGIKAFTSTLKDYRAKRAGDTWDKDRDSEDYLGEDVEVEDYERKTAPEIIEASRNRAPSGAELQH